MLASVFETCAFNNVNVLKFLLSGAKTLDGLLRMSGYRVSASGPPGVPVAGEEPVGSEAGHTKV